METKETEEERVHASREAKEHIQRFNHLVDALKNLVIVFGMVITVFVFFWNAVGRPYAQSFITDTLDDRIGAIEEQQQEFARTQQNILSQIQILQNTAEGSQDVQAEILRLLRLGLNPAPVIIPAPPAVPTSPPDEGQQ